MPIKTPRLSVAIFSYNRGAYLANCLASLARHMPDSLTWIFDDGSDDPATRAILERAKATCRVFITDRHIDGIYLGGLHANMNKALELAMAEGIERLFLVQDDQQFVRPCDAAFFQSCEEIFSSDPTLVQINTLFLKGFLPNSYYLDRLTILTEPPHYRMNEGNGIGDNGLIHVDRLVCARYRFADNETASCLQASALGLKTAHHPTPNIMYTPWPATIRPRSWKVAMLVKLNEWGIGAGCNPFCDMSREENAAFMARPLIDLPIAERYLRTIKPLMTPWWYSEIFDLDRLTHWQSLLTLRWIFDGPSVYRDYVDALEHLSQTNT